jgi:hypothetical protein
MPSFTFSSRMREGQWRAFRRFLLEERRDAAMRVQAIQAELERIGEVVVLYERDAGGRVTERRRKLIVTPEGSSLCKLVQAYAALGGNPFDISMFIGPDRSVGIGEGETRATTPGGGVLHLQDIKYSYDQGVTDGDTNLLKYRASRMGGKHFAQQEAKVLGIIQRGRKWITKEIWWKRTKIEEQILKLMDLREQLEGEIEDIVWATRGESGGDQGWDPDRFNESLTAAAIANFFDSTFRVPSSEDPGRVPYDNAAEEGQAGSVNTGVLGGYQSLMSDEDEEENTAM